MPKGVPIADTDAKNENEFAGLGSGQRYSEIVAYLRERQEFYRKYLPDGQPIAKLSDSELGAWWKCAATIIQEFEAFINIVDISTDAVRQSRRG